MRARRGARTRAMLFNSLEFPFFLALVLVGYYAVLPGPWWRARKILLLVASYVFYMSWNPFFGCLLAFSTVLDFSVGRALDRTAAPAARRLLLGASLLGNLGLLGYFKYGRFVAENLAALFGRPAGAAPPLADVILPVGISFYTFQTLSYALDVYRRALPAWPSLLDFATYVAFFPQLVAGPIVRAGVFLPQLVAPPSVRERGVELALARIAAGFVKKVVFADTLGAFVDVYWNPVPYRGWTLLLAIYAYAYQIYFDFSGYSDIALGVAGLLGFRLPENFERPYLAASPREFWRRWHISLSTWLRDYLYIPLGGSRGSRTRLGVALLVTMLLGGLWHGAAWTFVLWGAYHGILLVVQRLFLPGADRPRHGLALAAARVVTFHLVCLGWVLFRSRSLGDAWEMVSGLWPLEFVPSEAAGRTLVLLAVAFALHVGPPAPVLARRFASLPPWCQGLGYATAAMLVFAFSPATARFIYFQF